MALDCIYSFLSGNLKETELNRILKLLKGLGFTLNHPILQLNGKTQLAIALQEFQEHLGGKLTLLMLDGIGIPKEIYTIDHSLLETAFEQLVRHN